MSMFYNKDLVKLFHLNMHLVQLLYCEKLFFKLAFRNIKEINSTKNCNFIIIDFVTMESILFLPYLENKKFNCENIGI